MRFYLKELYEQSIALDATTNLVLLLTAKAFTSRATSLAVDYISEITIELLKLRRKCKVYSP